MQTEPISKIINEKKDKALECIFIQKTWKVKEITHDLNHFNILLHTQSIVCATV